MNPSIDANLEAAGIRAVSCGLNADWSVDAWLVGPGDANLTDGALYLLDNEDGDNTYNVARRFYSDSDTDPNDRIEYVGQDLPLPAAVALILTLI